MGRVSNRSPGPIYMLPPTVGFKDHDYRIYRAPAYSISPRLGGGFGRDKGTPGPQYQVYGFTEHGKASPPAFSLTPRLRTVQAYSGPGPGAHSPIIDSTKHKLPMWTMAPRYNITSQSIGPGPLAYKLPSTLGPKVPNKHVNGAYTMSPRLQTVSKSIGPGPAGYGFIQQDVVKYRTPKYTMSPRYLFSGKDGSPGPAAYRIQLGTDGPKYSMGRMLGEPDPYITPQDNIPCDDRK